MRIWFIALVALSQPALADSPLARKTQKAPDIEVVASWADLRAQQVLRVGPYEIRVGLSSYVGSAASPPHLWGIVTGGPRHDTRIGATEGEGRLGPLRLYVQRLGSSPARCSRCFAKECRRLVLPWPGRRVHVTLLGGGEPGDYRVELREDNNAERLIARTTIALLDRNEPVWTGLCRVGKGFEPLLSSRLPAFRGGDHHAPPKTQALPRILPARPTLRLQRRGGKLILFGGRQWGSAERRLLARWWRNGVPVTTGVHQKQKLRQAVDRLRRERAELILPIGDLSALGVKRGDRVAVQLLWCPRGWERARRGLRQLKEQRKIGDRERVLAELSSRVEWTVK